MAISALYESSETISTTEYSLPNDANYAAGSVKTDDGIFQCWIDLSAMVAGDVYTFRAYEKVQSAGTVRRFMALTLDGVQVDPHFVTPSFIFMHGWDFTLQRTAGTDRSIAWSIRQVA